jgi:hypothetical protein
MLHSMFVHHRYGKHHAFHCKDFNQGVISAPLIPLHAHSAFLSGPAVSFRIPLPIFFDALAASSQVP